jgi:hypothetical protein
VNSSFFGSIEAALETISYSYINATLQRFKKYYNSVKFVQDYLYDWPIAVGVGDVVECAASLIT